MVYAIMLQGLNCFGTTADEFGPEYAYHPGGIQNWDNGISGRIHEF